MLYDINLLFSIFNPIKFLKNISKIFMLNKLQTKAYDKQNENVFI